MVRVCYRSVHVTAATDTLAVSARWSRRHAALKHARARTPTHLPHAHVAPAGARAVAPAAALARHAPPMEIPITLRVALLGVTRIVLAGMTHVIGHAEEISIRRSYGGGGGAGVSGKIGTNGNSIDPC